MRCINRKQQQRNYHHHHQEQQQQQQQQQQRCRANQNNKANSTNNSTTTTSTAAAAAATTTSLIHSTTTASSASLTSLSSSSSSSRPSSHPHRSSSTTTTTTTRRYLMIVSSSTIFLVVFACLLANQISFVTGVIGPARKGVVHLFTTNTTRLIRFARRPFTSLPWRRRPRTIRQQQQQQQQQQQRSVVQQKSQQQSQQRQQPFVTTSTSTFVSTGIRGIDNNSIYTNYSFDHAFNENENILSNNILQHHPSTPKQRTKKAVVLPAKAAFVGYRHYYYYYYYSPSMLVAATTTDALWNLAVRGGDISSSRSSSSAAVSELTTESTTDEDENEEEQEVDRNDDDMNQTTTTIIEEEDNNNNNNSNDNVTALNNDTQNTTTTTTITSNNITGNSKYHFSLYQKGDGSEDDIDKIPIRYMKMQLDNREKAKHALDETLKWRIEHNTDYIIGRPHPDYDVCKSVFPHYFVGRDRYGNVAFVQRPALLNLELAKKNGLTNQGLLDHYVYVNEYLWQVVEAERPLATMTSIIDLQGLNLSVLRQGDIISFLKIFVKTMDSHFPQRAHITLLVNAPKWFHMLYKLLSPLLRESTKSKIFIYTNGPKQDEAFRQQLSEDSVQSLPSVFWSHNNDKNSPVAGDDDGSSSSTTTTTVHHHTTAVSELEKNLHEFTLARLKEAGVEMQKVVY